MNRAASFPEISAFSYVTNTFTDRVYSTSNFTFTGVSIGTADANRIIVLVVGGYSNAASGALGTLSSVTVGGNTATQIITQAIGTLTTASIYAIAVPTGTTADIVVAHGGATTCGVGVYRMISNTLRINAKDAKSTFTSGNTPNALSVNLSTSANSPVVAVAYGQNDGTVTWTNVTEDFDVDTRSTENLSGASLYPSNNTGTLTVTATKSIASASNFALCAASWGN